MTKYFFTIGYMRKLSVALFVLLCTALPAFSQMEDPIKWKTTAKKTAPNEYDIIFTATLEKGWHLYSQDINPDAGTPTRFVFNKGSYQTVGKVKELGKLKKVYDETSGSDLLYYENKVDFVQHVKLNGPLSKIEGTYDFQVCTDEMCLQPSEGNEFSVAVQFDKGASAATENTTATTDEATDKPIGTLVQSPNILGGKNAQMQEPTKWKYTVNKLNDKEYELRFTAEIEKGWHIYGIEKTGDDGPTATSFNFKKSADYELVGEIQSLTKSVKKYDTVFKQDVYTIDEKAEFVQKIKLLNPVKNISGQLVYMTCNDVQCIPGEADFSFEIDKNVTAKAVETVDAAPKSLLLTVFGQGFIGGLLALLTPCVFPMIPLTVSFFTKKGGNKKTSSIGSAALFGLSIIGIYVSLGFLITVIFGAEALNEIASNLYLNFVFFALFFIFALSFLGAFEITLPSSWANKADEKSEKGGIIGIFFMAFTLAIVSFSCTGVIIGSLLVEAIKGGISGPITGMLGFAVALALPFTLFAIFPSWMQSLPKSGGWLNSVKVVLGFVELALAFKFLSTADLIGDWGLLKREYFLVIWIIIFTLMGFYLLGKLKFSHDSDVSYISVPRLLMAVLSFAFALYMVPGLWGAPVKLLSGLAPPMHYNEGFLNGSGNHVTAATSTTANADKPTKYTERFHAPNGLTAYFDYEEGVAAAKKQNKPLLIDFTGWSCVNCRKMEENVWPDPRILNRIANDYILVQLYVDEKKIQLPENEVYTSKFGKKINTLGRKWSDIQMTRYNSNSQPFYVLADHDGNPLVTPRGYDADIEAYAAFLEEGVTKFKAQNK